MARLHPPVPRFDLPDLEFELVVALEDYLDDSYLVLQPSHAPLRELTGGRRPVVDIHPTEGVAAILPVAQMNRSPVLRAIGSRQVDSDPYASHARLAAIHAERWLGLPGRKILGLVYDPDGSAEVHSAFGRGRWTPGAASRPSARRPISRSARPPARCLSRTACSRHPTDRHPGR